MATHEERRADARLAEQEEEAGVRCGCGALLLTDDELIEHNWHGPVPCPYKED